MITVTLAVAIIMGVAGGYVGQLFTMIGAAIVVGCSLVLEAVMQPNWWLLLALVTFTPALLAGLVFQDVARRRRW